MFIIDGYNCTFAGSAMGGPWESFSVRHLCALLDKSRTPAMVVLDGRPKPHEPDENDFPGVTLIYSGSGVKADDVISRKLSQRTDRRRVTVVSNDRAVAADARRQNARSESCEKFLRSLWTRVGKKSARRGTAEPPEKSTGVVNLGETQHWLREFGLEATAAPPLRSATISRPAPAATPAPSVKNSGRKSTAYRQPSRRQTPPVPLPPSPRKSAPSSDPLEWDDRMIDRLIGPVDRD